MDRERGDRFIFVFVNDDGSMVPSRGGGHCPGPTRLIKLKPSKVEDA